MKPFLRRKRFLLLAIPGLLLAGGIALVLLMKRPSAPPVAGQTAAAPGAPAATVALASARAQATPAATEEKKTPIPVSVAAVTTGAVSSYITSTANLVAENEVKILAEAEGRVAELHVEEGDRVSRGQVIAALAHDDAEIALKKAEFRAANARTVMERAVKLKGDHLMSGEQFDKLSLEDQVAQQELAEARWRYEKTMIRAPFAGRITGRDIRLGQHIRPGETLFTVTDFDPLIARIYLPERDVLGLREGREVRITLKADERTRVRGRIRQISPVVDVGTGTVKVTIEATAPPAEVRPGAFVTIDIVRETRAAATLLPREAIIRELNDAYVFVARGDLAEKRTVSLGLEEGGRVEALSGVAPGDQVIVAGQGGLKQGSTIKIIPTTEASSFGAPEDRRIAG